MDIILRDIHVLVKFFHSFICHYFPCQTMYMLHNSSLLYEKPLKWYKHTMNTILTQEVVYKVQVQFCDSLKECHIITTRVKHTYVHNTKQYLDYPQSLDVWIMWWTMICTQLTHHTQFVYATKSHDCYINIKMKAIFN